MTGEAEWQPIETIPVGMQVMVWEPDYGWLVACKSHYTGDIEFKGTGNFWGAVPSVKPEYWRKLPLPPAAEALLRNQAT